MYAIIETGGKQYKVEKGDIIDVELLDAKTNEKLEFKNVLFINNAGTVKVGNPTSQNRVVHAELVQEVKGLSFAFKYKQRKHIRAKSATANAMRA